MLLALSVISPNGAGLGPTAYKVFDQRGGTIGRVEGNDWVLPDPDKFVSSRHANVRWSGGAYYLEDTSTNGTFINAPDQPVPRDGPVRLQDGDRIFIGDYEIMVQLIDAAPAEEPAPAPAPPPPGLGLGTVDPLAALGGARSERGRAPTSAAAPAPAAAATAAPAAGHGVPPPGIGLGARPAASAPSAAPSAALGGTSIHELLTAMGLDPARVPADIQQQLGAILRVVVEGMIAVLKSRAEVKNSFRMPMTSIKPVENNPLKFSMNVDDALYNLFVKRNPGYLGAYEAFREGFQDIEFHQDAVLAGIRAAFNAMLAKFHPDHLEELYERKLRRTAMLGLGSRMKYWELYRAQFEEIDRDREAHFQLLFGEEFARAYNERLQKLAADARYRRR